MTELKAFFKVIYIVILAFFTQPVNTSKVLIGGLWESFKSKWHYANFIALILNFIAVIAFWTNLLAFSAQIISLNIIGWIALICSWYFLLMSRKLKKKQEG